MRLYGAYFKVRFIAGLQYRSAALAGMVTQFVWGYLSIVLFQTFGGDIISKEHIAGYFWMRQAFLALTVVWMGDASVFLMIEDGTVSYELLRPTDLYTMWFVRNLGHRLSRCLLRAVPMLIVACLLPQPYTLVLPGTPVLWLQFGISLFLSLLTAIAITLILYALTMKTKQSNGVRIFATALFDLLDGGNIPYPFFPPLIQIILKNTFFYSLQTAPFFLFLGIANSSESIMIQSVWLLILVMTGKVLLNKEVIKLEVFGG